MSAQMRRLQSENPEGFQRRWEEMRTKNPMTDPGVKERAVSKAKKTCKERGVYEKNLTGGNGAGLTKIQQELFDQLPAGWAAEYRVPGFHWRQTPDWPVLLIDLAFPEKKWAVELDGISHNTLKAREKDARKNQHLADAGWKLLRMKNHEATLEKIREFFGSLE